MCAATTDVTQNANRANRGGGPITDADVAAVLRPFVRATRPLLGALSDADPFGLQARARQAAADDARGARGAHAARIGSWTGSPRRGRRARRRGRRWTCTRARPGGCAGSAG